MSIAIIEAQIAQLTKTLNTLKFAQRKQSASPILCLFDLETTGLGKTAHIKICEYGMVNYTTGRVFQRHVNPLQAVSESVTRIHGLRSDFLARQSSWKRVGVELNDAIEEARDGDNSKPVILGGFNSKRYDSRILTFEHHRHGLRYPPNVFFVDFREILTDFVPLQKKKGLAEYHKAATGKEIVSAHTAVADARAIANILDTITDRDALFEKIEGSMEATEACIRRCFK
jgi:DNA polymerase III epsilon subunit-like protein